MQKGLLGHGSCATCFEAEDCFDGKIVALKVIRRTHIHPVCPLANVSSSLGRLCMLQPLEPNP